MRNRAILFDKVDNQIPDMLMILGDLDKQLALSDHQMQQIDELFLIRSLDEFVAKFPLREDMFQAKKREASEQNSVNDATHRELDIFLEYVKQVEASKDYLAFWYDRSFLKEEEEELSFSAKGRYYQELFIEIQAFFFQCAVNKVENPQILVTNTDPKDLMDQKNFRKMDLYLETANNKQEQAGYIQWGILPNMGIELHGAVRQRFVGFEQKQFDDERVLLPEDAEPVLRLMGKHNGFLCMQFLADLRSTSERFAQNGRAYFAKHMRQLEKHEYSQYACCCYPNLSSDQENIYLGAAFVTVAMLMANAEEGSQTAFPRELYPYEEDVRAQITTARKRDFILISEQDGFDDEQWRMILHSARTLGYRDGHYLTVNEVVDQTKK